MTENGVDQEESLKEFQGYEISESDLCEDDKNESSFCMMIYFLYEIHMLHIYFLLTEYPNIFEVA